MAEEQHHEHLLKELTNQLQPMYNQSKQSIYLYLDDTHKSCNQKFADMLGYQSIDAWVANEFPVEDIIEEDRDNAIQAFIKASENYTASCLSASWIKQDGTKIKTEMMLVPIPHKGEIFVLHFITEK